MIISRPTFHPAYLAPSADPAKASSFKVKHNGLLGRLGQVFLAVTFFKGIHLVRAGGLGTYMGLIIIWAFPFLFLLWYANSYSQTISISEILTITGLFPLISCFEFRAVIY